MGLGKAVDTDNAEVYLVTILAAALNILDGHRHGGGVDGLTITSVAHGLNAALPAAGVAGAVYIGTDSGRMYYDVGGVWIPIVQPATLDYLTNKRFDATSNVPVLLATSGPSVVASATLDFSAIPQGYRELRLGYRVKQVAGGVGPLGLRINGLNGANYDSEYTYTSGDASTVPDSVIPVQSLAATSWQLGTMNATGDLAAQFTVGDVVIPYYALTDANKSGMFRSAYKRTNGASGGISFFAGGLHYRGAGAITELTLIGQDGANFEVGSAAFLYGYP
jgi:hypothetical protein